MSIGSCYCGSAAGFGWKPAALMLAMISYTTANAAEVGSAEAREAVAGWAALGEALTYTERFAAAEISKVETFEGKDGRGSFHVVSFAGGGFAVTSGDTGVAPILAYSEDGEFVAGEENPLWVMLATDVAGRTKRLGMEAVASANSTKGAKPLGVRTGADESSNESAWARFRKAGADAAGAPTRGKTLLKAAYPKIAAISDLCAGPLCEARWNQGNVGASPCYNYYTPSNRVCGCVATAMAQIMYRFKYPDMALPLGETVYQDQFIETESKTNTWHVGGQYGDTWEYGGCAFGGPYEWGKMAADPLAAHNAGTLTEESRKAIGRLCRDCGISVTMKYKLHGSSAKTGDIGKELVGRFGYANAAVRYRNGDEDVIDHTEQRNAMLNSFDIGSPCAISIDGHSIVADGYGYHSDNRLYIHFNWGWGSGGSGKKNTAWYTPPDDSEEDCEYPTVVTIVYNIWTPNERTDSAVSVVAGTLLDASSNAVASAAVRAVSVNSGAEFAATTDERGTFRLFLPGDDTYALSATNGCAAAWRTLDVAACKAGQVGNVRDVKLVLGSEAGGFDDIGWVCETAKTKEYTGKWSPDVVYDLATGRATLPKGAVFTPNAPSSGNRVTMDVVAELFCASGDEFQSDPAGDAQCAVRLSTDIGFQVWTRDGWLDVAAQGVTPANDTQYALRFALDYAQGVYSAYVKDGGGEWRQFEAEGGVSAFPLAAQSRALSSVMFFGETVFMSLAGECVSAECFVEHEEIALAGATNVLNAARALWLNGLGDKADVAAAAAALSAGQFDAAYLLNFDFTAGEFSYTFNISDIQVVDDHVEVAVTLHRTGATHGAVNGTLNFYGAATLEAFKSGGALLGTATLSVPDASGDETATATIQLEGENPPAFFNAAIEEKGQ